MPVSLLGAYRRERLTGGGEGVEGGVSNENVYGGGDDPYGSVRSGWVDTGRAVRPYVLRAGLDVRLARQAVDIDCADE
jgi:hypothetical protein